MYKNKWEIWKEKNKGDSFSPWDMLNPKVEKLSKKESEKRLKICLGCDRLIKSTKQCKECGCFMSLKTQIANASCPLHKWGNEDAIDNK
jgi:hypothetical protein